MQGNTVSSAKMGERQPLSVAKSARVSGILLRFSTEGRLDHTDRHTVREHEGSESKTLRISAQRVGPKASLPLSPFS